MTKKGELIKDHIVRLLERNPDGLRVGRLTELLDVSRNSVYRYLNILKEEGLICKLDTKLWVLTNPIKPQTILGYQYQALLQGLKQIGGEFWNIELEEGRHNFKELGKYISPKMKGTAILDLEKLKQQNHHLQDIIAFGMKLIDETSSVENYNFHYKLDSNGFPLENTHLAGLVTFKGGYVQSAKVRGNGFAHYYIIAGIIEASFDRIIPEIYGGRVVVDLLKMDEVEQSVDIGLFVIFDKETPFIDPKTGRQIAHPQRELRLKGNL